MPEVADSNQTEGATVGGWGVPNKAGSGGSGAPTKSSKRKKPSKVTPIYGERVTKYYNVASGELWGLFGASAIAAFSFSIAVNLFVFSIEIHKDLAFNSALPTTLIEEWHKYENNCFNFGLLALAMSLIFTILGGIKIFEIKNSTKF